MVTSGVCLRVWGSSSFLCFTIISACIFNLNLLQQASIDYMIKNRLKLHLESKLPLNYKSLKKDQWATTSQETRGLALAWLLPLYMTGQGTFSFWDSVCPSVKWEDWTIYAMHGPYSSDTQAELPWEWGRERKRMDNICASV